MAQQQPAPALTEELDPPPCPTHCGPVANPCFGRECVADARRLISFCWLVANSMVFCFLCCAIAVAAANDCDEYACSRSVGFAAIWMMLMCILLMIGGTKVMRHVQSEVAVGFFLGVVVMMALDMFMLAVIFGGNASKAHDAGTDAAPAEAACVFSLFLSVAYGTFAVVLAKFRDEVIRDDSVFEEPAAGASVDGTKQVVTHQQPGAQAAV